MPAFPTFRLPFLAAKAVINRMDLGDLTILSLCSKKARKFIKSLRKPVSFVALSFEQKESLTALEIIELFREEKLAGEFFKEYKTAVNIQISDDIGFELFVEFDKTTFERGCLFFKVHVECNDRQDEYKGAKNFLKIGGIDVPVVMTKKDKMYMFWDSKEEGCKAIGEYLGQYISPEISYLKTYGGRKPEYSEMLRFIINWMNSTNQIPQKCEIYDSDGQINEEDVKFILDNVHPKEDLLIWAALGDQFQYNAHFNLNYFVLFEANWFSLENLFVTECKNIRLRNSKLTNQDLNAYLKQWMEGKFPKLRRLDVGMQEDVNIEIILYNLKNSPEDDNIKLNDDRVSIERNDSHCVAEILTPGRSSNIFTMTTSFSHLHF